MKSKETKKPDEQYRRLLVEVAASESKRCSTDPNIACVGYGLKIVNGKPTMRVSLQYHVLEKCPSADEIAQKGSQLVPKSVDGYETDVLQWSIDRSAACPASKPPTGERGGRQEDPLVGGSRRCRRGVR